jgi:hypothetical protein
MKKGLPGHTLRFVTESFRLAWREVASTTALPSPEPRALSESESGDVAENELHALYDKIGLSQRHRSGWLHNQDWHRQARKSRSWWV